MCMLLLLQVRALCCCGAVIELYFMVYLPQLSWSVHPLEKHCCIDQIVQPTRSVALVYLRMLVLPFNNCDSPTSHSSKTLLSF